MSHPEVSAADRLLSRLLMRVRPARLATWVKARLNVQRRLLRTSEGTFLVDPVSHLGHELLLKGSYEPEMADTLRAFLKPGDVFVDVGANEGYFSVLGAKQVTQRGRVISVEPQARLLPVIAENLRLNEVTNATVVNMAISASKGSVDLYLAPDTNSGSSGIYNTGKTRRASAPVMTQTLTELLAESNIQEAALIKIDVEGFEYEVVMGSQEVFCERRIRALALEFHPEILASRGLAMAPIGDFLMACGYELDRRFINTVFVRK